MGFSEYPDINEILHVPGLLFWGATSLNNEVGWGTKLGFCEAGVLFEPGFNSITLAAPETGNEPIWNIFTGYAPIVYADLKNYNGLVLARLFPGITNQQAVRYPDDMAIKPGANLFTYQVDRLLFVPDDLDNNPILLLQQAAPHILDTAKLRFSHPKATTFPVLFNGVTMLDENENRKQHGNFYLGPIENGAIIT